MDACLLGNLHDVTLVPVLCPLSYETCTRGPVAEAGIRTWLQTGQPDIIAWDGTSAGMQWPNH